MGVALLSAKRSKDPSTQVGACIVNNKNKIVGAGTMVYLLAATMMISLGKKKENS